MISEVSVNFNFGRLSDKIESIINKYLNDDFAEQVVKASKEKIKSGKVTPALSPTTIAIRQKRGTGGSRPLYKKSMIKGKDVSVNGKQPRNFIAIPKASSEALAKDMNDALIMQAPIVLKVGKR